MAQIKAVIFDMDGTILDTVEDIGESINRAKSNHGVSVAGWRPRDYTAAIGGGIRKCIRNTLPEGTSEEVYQAVVNDYLTLYPQHCLDNTRPFPGIPELLNDLRSAGVRTGVITNKTERTAQLMAQSLFAENAFDFVWGNDLVRPLKPAAEAGAAACAWLGLPPEEIAYVGDSGETDIAFGKASGFYTVGVTWGYRDRSSLEQYGADDICDSAEQLQSLLLS